MTIGNGRSQSTSLDETKIVFVVVFFPKNDFQRRFVHSDVLIVRPFRTRIDVIPKVSREYKRHVSAAAGPVERDHRRIRKNKYRNEIITRVITSIQILFGSLEMNRARRYDTFRRIFRGNGPKTFPDS